MDKHAIIRLKREGHSNRNAAKILGIERKTVAKYWNEFKEIISKMGEKGADIALFQEAIASPPKYDSSTRKARKYTDEIDELLGDILKQEEEKGFRVRFFYMVGCGYKEVVYDKKLTPIVLFK